MATARAGCTQRWSLSQLHFGSLSSAFHECPANAGRKIVSNSRSIAKPTFHPNPVGNDGRYAHLVTLKENKRRRRPLQVMANVGNLETSGEDAPDIRELQESTRLLQIVNDFDPYSAMSTPIYQTATFAQPSATENGPYDYTRSGNPTRTALEKVLADAEGAKRAFAFTTGMAALAVVTNLTSHGEEIVAADDIYGGTDRLLSRVVPRSGVTVKRVNTTDLDALRAAITSKTKLVMLESPTNPRLVVSDLQAVADIAHEKGALVVVDNSIMSPLLSKPLELGADIVMHSATKFIAGHSDVMAGVLAVNDDSLADAIYFQQNALGVGLAPFEAYLCLRGIKTMALRIERQQSNANKIARFLAGHPHVTRVNHVGLPSHPGHDLHFRQAKGAGSVFSFLTGSLPLSKHVVESTKLFKIAVSFGSVHSTISLPCFMSHASIPADVREERGLTEDLIRLSVGIEDVDDLIADLTRAFDSAPKS